MRRILTMGDGSDGSGDGGGDGGGGGAGGDSGGGTGGGDGGGGTAPSWRDGVSEDIRSHPALADIADIPTLAQSYIETKSLVGRKGIILPKEGDAGDLARFRTEIGVPDSAEGYDLGDFKPPEGLPWSDGFQTAMLEKLHARGIPNGQIREILDDYAEVSNGEYTGMVDAQKQGHTNGTEALKKELGSSYDASVGLSQRAFKAAAGDNFDAVANLTLADGTQLGDNLAFVKTFINVGKQYQEAGLHGEKSGGGGFMLTPEAAQKEFDTISGHVALYDDDHPEHAAIVARKSELAKMAWPEEIRGG